jgi:Carboxypeptidase regulatory-like domain
VLLVLSPTVWTLVGHGRSVSRTDNSQVGKITGTVLDKNEARIAGATIKIENSELSRVVRSNYEGYFEVELPAGMYRMTVEMAGFKRFVLSPFRVKARVRKSVSLHMEAKPPASTLKIGQVTGLRSIQNVGILNSVRFLLSRINGDCACP